MAERKRNPNNWGFQPVKDKLQAWVDKNEERWYTVAIEDVIAESGVSESTVHRYLYLMIARKAKITPTEVHVRRREAKGMHPWQRKLRKEEIEEIIKLYYEGNTSVDIAFITGRAPSTVAKYRPEDLESTAHIRKRTLAEHKAANPEVFGHIGPDMTEEDIKKSETDGE